MNFRDRLTSPVPRLRDVVRCSVAGGLRVAAADLPEAAHIPVHAAERLPELAAGRTDLTWVGHATYLIRIGGLTVLTDPVWSRRIPGVRPRLTPPGLPWSAVGRVDAVVISHNHYDHLDGPTIRRLDRSTPVLVPLGLGRWFARRGFETVHELDWYAGVELGGVRFDLVPAHHWSRRTATDTCRSLWGGWVLTGPDHRIHFTGDSGYGHFFEEIGQRYPGLDVSILPIGAYRPRWFLRPMHMDPAEAVRAYRDLGAARMATMHWGTFGLSSEPPLEPARTVRAVWEQTGLARRDLWDLAVGETRLLD